MKFIHITDLHLVPPGQKLWGFDPFPRLDQCLADIMKHHGRRGILRHIGRSHGTRRSRDLSGLKERLKNFRFRFI